MSQTELRVHDAQFSGCTALVTGASRGLGFEVARHLCSGGAKVALCSRSEAEIERTSERLRDEFGANVWGGVADVSSHIEMERFASESLARFGPANFIVNNAAVFGPVGSLELSHAMSWSETLDINVKGVAFVTAAFRRQLEESGRGRVVNLSGGGVGGPKPLSRASAYLTSKYAVAGLTEALASDFFDTGVTVNAVAPGSFPTSFMNGAVQAGPEIAGEELFADASSRVGDISQDDLKLFLELLDYLLSDAASNISGRLLSARWDAPKMLQALTDDQIDDNLFRVRRIDDDLFYRKER